MELDKFIVDFAELFEDTDTSLFVSHTKFKELEEWSSLQALLIIGLADESYGVRVNGEELNTVQTIEDLFQLIKSKK